MPDSGDDYHCHECRFTVLHNHVSVTSAVCGHAVAGPQALARHLEPHRALVIVAWLEDLKTVLPAHASQGVADSLQRREGWAEGASMATADPAAVNDTPG